MTQDPKADHGYRNEVSWDDGKGRQPYPNQEPQTENPPNGGDEFEAGDRGDFSGRNLDQQERARGTPGQVSASEDAEQHQQQHDGKRDAE